MIARTFIFRRSSRSGFVLLEVMLAVSIFALGVLALGSCVSNCLVAERLKDEDSRVNRFLGNRMAEIEAGSIALSDSSTEDLTGMWDGMKLRTTRTPLERKDENGKDILGIYIIHLELSWMSDNQPQTHDLSFYVYPRQQ